MTYLSGCLPQKSLFTLSPTDALGSSLAFILLSSLTTTTISQSGMFLLLSTPCHSASSSFTVCLYTSRSCNCRKKNSVPLKQNPMDAVIKIIKGNFSHIREQNIGRWYGINLRHDWSTDQSHLVEWLYSVPQNFYDVFGQYHQFAWT